MKHTLEKCCSKQNSYAIDLKQYEGLHYLGDRINVNGRCQAAVTIRTSVERTPMFQIWLYPQKMTMVKSQPNSNLINTNTPHEQGRSKVNFSCSSQPFLP